MSKPMEFLTADSIYLRGLTLEDVNDAYYSWLNDPQVNQYLETRYLPSSKQDIEAFVKSKMHNKDEPIFAICDKETDTHIGNIKLGPICWLHRRAQISLLIGDKNYWGKGVATQAIKQVCDYGFSRLNLNKLFAGAYSDNQGSIKAFKKCGFKEEGVLKAYYIVDGQELDLVYIGVTNQEYREFQQ